MMARYIIRLDDACPTMNKAKWDEVEYLLDSYGIKPIVAVIPNNRNNNLVCDQPDSLFWNKVQEWSDKGWGIALHGYDHVYISNSQGLVSTNRKSEFAGVVYAIQREKIANAWKIFVDQKIIPKIWIAPAHTFDDNTLRALKEITTITTISDGIAFGPYYEKNFYWIPQQLWRFRKMPFGIWTICLHPNTMTENDIRELRDHISINAQSFIDISELKYSFKKRTLLDDLLRIYFKIKFRNL